jgi:hypothetical protein
VRTKSSLPPDIVSRCARGLFHGPFLGFPGTLLGRVAPTKLRPTEPRSGVPAKHGRQTTRSQLKTDLGFSIGVESRADDAHNSPIRPDAGSAFGISSRGNSWTRRCCLGRLTSKALQWLFQHINGLSPASQFSPSGGAGNARTRGPGIPTRPSI